MARVTKERAKRQGQQKQSLSSLALAVLFTVALTIDIAGQGEGPRLEVKLVADGLVAPLDLTFAPDRSGLRFIVDQTGLVLILTPAGQVLPTPFLDITDRTVLQSAFDERGLLAVAFHPQFATNGKLYVQYSAQREGPNICVAEDGRVPTDPAGCPLQYTRQISEFVVSSTDPNRADPSTRTGRVQDSMARPEAQRGWSRLRPGRHALYRPRGRGLHSWPERSGRSIQRRS